MSMAFKEQHSSQKDRKAIVEELSDSDISEDGVPDSHLRYVVDPNIAYDIEDRRNERRLSRAKAKIDYAAMNSVVSQLGKILKPSQPSSVLKNSHQQHL